MDGVAVTYLVSQDAGNGDARGGAGCVGVSPFLGIST